MEARQILEQVREGSISVEEAEKYFKKQPFEELGYAKLDTHREIRSGFPEVVFCSGKPDAFLVSIYQKLMEENGAVRAMMSGSGPTVFGIFKNKEEAVHCKEVLEQKQAEMQWTEKGYQPVKQIFVTEFVSA